MVHNTAQRKIEAGEGKKEKSLGTNASLQFTSRLVFLLCIFFFFSTFRSKLQEGKKVLKTSSPRLHVRVRSDFYAFILVLVYKDSAG